MKQRRAAIMTSGTDAINPPTLPVAVFSSHIDKSKSNTRDIHIAFLFELSYKKEIFLFY